MLVREPEPKSSLKPLLNIGVLAHTRSDSYQFF